MALSGGNFTQKMFTPEERARLRAELLDCAASDPHLEGAAITGSAAGAGEDPWSDIDLAFSVSDASHVPNVLADWTARMYSKYSALHHVDIKAGAWIYRVFFLSSTLQVDLAFVRSAEFRALGQTFRLVFGTASPEWSAPPPDTEEIAGLAWLHALHVRSCIGRGHLWQAEYMISGVRNHALMLACARHGLPTAHGRGFDHLPPAVTDQFEGSLARQLDGAELARAFQVAIDGLIGEIEKTNDELAARLSAALKSLAQGTNQ